MRSGGRPADGPMTGAAGRVGPNAITRVAEALVAACGAEAARAVFARAGLDRHLRVPPTAMVDEAEITALHLALRASLGAALAERVAAEAGERTAAYILAHRIPALARVLLRLLPPAPAAALLARAIARHAWTFAGSGTFRVARGRPLRFVVSGGPLGARLAAEAPACAYYAATFAGLFRALVHPAARVTETECAAAGAPACVFAIDWPRQSSGRTRISLASPRA